MRSSAHNEQHGSDDNTAPGKLGQRYASIYPGFTLLWAVVELTAGRNLKQVLGPGSKTVLATAFSIKQHGKRRPTAGAPHTRPRRGVTPVD